MNYNNIIKKIKEMKQNPKGKAILKLIGWAIFFLLVFIFCLITSFLKPSKISTPSYNPSNIEVIEPIKNSRSDILENKTIDENLNLLTNNEYDYEYNITTSEKYTYKGHFSVTNDIGYKESNMGIIKYKIEEANTYELTMDNEILIDNLYEGIDNNKINPYTILNNLKDKELKLNLENNYYELNEDNTNYQILLTENNIILEIHLSDDTSDYLLKFRNIGE